MTTEVALGTPRPAEVTMALAKALAGAGMLPYALRNKPSDVLLVMLTGRDLGIPPTFALNLIYVVDGHPTLSAKLQLALLRRSGHKVEEVECSPERVTLRGTHAVTGDVVTATYTYAEAEKATYTSWEGGEGEKRRKVTKKLVEKDNWQYREDMLYARCSSRLSRRLDPMATGGLYAPEDFGASDPEPVTVTVEAVEPHPESAEVPPEAEIEARAEAPREDEARTAYLREERPAGLSTRACFVVLRGPTTGQALTEAGLRSVFRHHRGTSGAVRVRPHRLRHTYGTELAAAGIDLLVLRELMGHASPDTTARYVHLSAETLAGEFAAARAELDR